MINVVLFCEYSAKFFVDLFLNRSVLFVILLGYLVYSVFGLFKGAGFFTRPFY